LDTQPAITKLLKWTI